jgi:hypothetical protein
MSEAVICKQIPCKDFLTDDGDPAWCYLAGQPAQVAMLKCPKAAGKKPEKISKEKIPNGNGRP